MTQSDPIADFLTRIRNAQQAQHRYVDIPYSKLKEGISEILKESSLVEKIIVMNDEKGKKVIRIYLKYTKNRFPVIQGLRRISRPGLRKYVNHSEIPKFFGGFGVPILSTSQGVMSGKDAAAKNIGGELVCLVW